MANETLAAHYHQDAEVPLPPGQTPRRWQVEAMRALRVFAATHQNILFSAATGCHAQGERVMRYGGGTVAAEDVAVGDLLMGPDSTPREVLALHRGRDAMYRIVPVKGEPFVVNGDHVLSLIDTREATDLNLRDVTVHEWLTWHKYAKHLHKLVRTGVEYPAREHGPIPAYHLGMLIGDGTLSCSVPMVTKPDPEIHDACRELAALFGLVLREYTSGGGTPCHRFVKAGKKSKRPNPLMVAIRDLKLDCIGAYRRIPESYLYGSRSDRMAILAGLLDTDGSLTTGGYDWLAKSHDLAVDMVTLARGLGLAAYITSKTIYTAFGGGEYWRVSISGDCSALPLRIPRKKAPPRQQIKSVLRTGFKVEPLPEADYFGFTVSGDNRYLLSDFTVTHNCGKGSLAAAILVKAARAKKRCLFIVHRDYLLDDVMARTLEIEPTLYAGKVKAKLNEMDRFTVFASVQTLQGKRLETVGRFDYVITDECHHSPSPSHRKLHARLREVNPKIKHIGFTATPFRNTGGGKTKGLGEAFDVLAYEYSLSDAITDGALCPIRCLSVETQLDLSGVDPDDEDRLEKMVDTPDRNAVIVQKYLEHLTDVDDDWNTIRHPAIAFCASVDHAVHLAEAMRESGIRAEAVWEFSKNQGKDKERHRKIDDYLNGRIDVLTNRSLLCEGFDAPSTRGVILASPTDSLGLFAQMVGRCTRLSPATGKTEGLVLDFVAASTTHNLVTVADLTRPTKNPRIEIGAEVRHRRLAELTDGMVMGLSRPGGGVVPDGPAGDSQDDPDGWIASVLWRAPKEARMRAAFDAGSADSGAAGAADGSGRGEREHRCGELVLLRPPRTAREEIVAPGVIGVREYAVTLFDNDGPDGAKGGAPRVAWYTYTTSTGAKAMLARGRVTNSWPETEISVLLQRAGETLADPWEVWTREATREGTPESRAHSRDSLTRACVGNFAQVRDVGIDLLSGGVTPLNWRDPWMKQAASDAQCRVLASFRVPTGDQAAKLSRGEASMLIEIRMMRNDIRALVAREAKRSK